MATVKGKLIVIDGGDGAGKATQVSLLVKRLEAEGHDVATLDFPRYEENTFGRLIRECLDGKRGDFMKVDPHIASVLYANDRLMTKPRIEEWLTAGKTVILDRYVSANMMHQGAKIEDPTELESFLGWLDHMEHEDLGLPRPDLIIYLSIAPEVRQEMKAKAVAEGKHGGQADVAEKDIDHQHNVEDRAKAIVAKYNHWLAVECAEGDAVRSREDIHEEIYRLVTKE
jgi:dTMP kinase